MIQLVYPLFQAFDDYGNFLEGGKLYSYIAGTSTETPLYTNKDLTSEHEIPIILDARGEAEIYGNGKYKLILTDADDNLIRTVSEVVISNAEAVIPEYITPEMFGAIGDYEADDTQAIQDALDEAYSRSNTYTSEIQFFGVIPVLFSPGKIYRITEGLNTYGTTALIGIFNPTFSTRPVIVMDPENTTDHLFTVLPTNIDDVTASISVSGLTFYNNRADKYVFYLPKEYDGKALNTSSNYFNFNRFCGGGGCVYAQQALDLSFSNNCLDVCSVGLRMEYGDEVRFHNNEIYGSTYGILVDDYCVGSAVGNSFRNCHNGHAFAFLNGRDLEASGGQTQFSIVGNQVWGADAPYSFNGILVSGYGNMSVILQGNLFSQVDSVIYDEYEETDPIYVTSNDLYGTVNQRIYYANASSYTVYDGLIYDKSGATGSRPVLQSGNAGFHFWDTTLGKAIFWDGSAWKYADGTGV